MEESVGINHNKMNDIISKEYFRQTRQILILESNSKNELTTFNTLAILVTSFGVNDWLSANILGMNRKTETKYLQGLIASF